MRKLTPFQYFLTRKPEKFEDIFFQFQLLCACAAEEYRLGNTSPFVKNIMAFCPPDGNYDHIIIGRKHGYVQTIAEWRKDCERSLHILNDDIIHPFDAIAYALYIYKEYLHLKACIKKYFITEKEILIKISFFKSYSSQAQASVCDL